MRYVIYSYLCLIYKGQRPKSFYFSRGGGLWLMIHAFQQAGLM